MKRRRTIFCARVGLVPIPQKACRDTLRRTCIFESDVIYGSRSALWCVRAVKRRRTNFHARVGP
jgi:hypothetical protein